MGTLQMIALFTSGLAVLGGLCILPITLSFKADRRKREMEHIERMMALEKGRSFPGEGVIARWAVPYQIAVSIGAVVPIVAFGCAWQSSMQVGFHDGIWLAAAIVGLGGVISGSTLAFEVFARSGATGLRRTPESAETGKPYISEDAYDVVSSRG